MHPPPRGWKPSSPPPPPPPPPPGSVPRYMRSPEPDRSSPRGPGLLNAATQDDSAKSAYLQNAVLIKMNETKISGSAQGTKQGPSGDNSAASDPSAFELDDVHIKTLETIFTLLDSNQDKLLDVDQLRTAIIAMGIPPAPRLIQQILSSVPAWAGNGVDFNTFKTVITERLKCNPVHMSDINELFKIFETTDGKGKITDVHLRHVMEVETTNKTNLSDDEVDEIFKELGLGINRKQTLDYRQFLKNISSGFINFA